MKIIPVADLLLLQEYIHNHPSSGYVQAVSIAEFLEFKKKFKAVYK